MTANNTEKKQQDDSRDIFGPCVVDLGRNLDIREAKVLYQRLSELNADSFVLDASAISRVDACGLQLLTSFIRHAESEGKSVEWLLPDENLLRATALLGLSEPMHLP